MRKRGRIIVYLGILSNFAFAQCAVEKNIISKTNFSNGFKTENTGSKRWCQTIVVDQLTDYNFSVKLDGSSLDSTNTVQLSVNEIKIGSAVKSSALSQANFCETWNTGFLTSNKVCFHTSPLAIVKSIEIGKVIGEFPVTLKSFSVENENANVQIKWTSKTEVSLEMYEVESSINGLDWKRIGASTAKLKSQDSANYLFVDYLPAEGLNFYRLKIISSNNEVEYSDVRIINHVFFSKILSNEFASVDNIVHLGASKEISVLRLLDEKGKTVYLQKNPNGIQSISLKGLGKGVYCLEFKTAKGFFNKEVIIKGVAH